MNNENKPQLAGKLSVRDLLERLTFRETLLVVALVEAICWWVTRITLQHFSWDTFQAESMRTVFRCVTALVFWLLMHDVITARKPDFSVFRGAAFRSAVVLFLLVPLVLQHYTMQPAFAWFFGIAALPVGIKEELLFRGLLQNLLNRRMGQAMAAVLAAALATLWHVGVVEHALWSYGLIFLANVFIGLVYARTGSLLLAIGVHTAYDVLFALPSLNWFRSPVPIAVCMLSYAIGMTCFGWLAAGQRKPT